MADFEDQIVRITDLATDSDVLERLEFERCTIIGPAVLIPVRSTFVDCSFVGAPDVLIWEVPQERGSVLGAVRLEDCSFLACRFARIGLGLRPDASDQFRDALTPTETQPSAAEPVAR